MNDGVRILLERMETHPEEFVGDGVYSKWNDMFETYADSLDPEDVEVYRNARKVLIQQYFTEKVMEELVDPTEETNVKKLGNMFTQRKRALAAQTPIQYTANELTRTHIEAHEKALGQTPIAGVTQTL
jgi:hypothetical protein